MRPSFRSLVVLTAVYGSCLLIVHVGFSTASLLVFALSAYARGLLTVAGHHRYFAHRSYRTSRPLQFLIALPGASCLQGGPLGWSAMHRHHHRHSDLPDDVISPVRHGFFWTQLHLWVGTQHPLVGKRIHDFDAFPELLWLERWWWLVPAGFVLGLYGLGTWLAVATPELGTSGGQLAVWGFCVANACLIQVASLVNSVCHRFGSQPFDNGDGSRNTWWVGLIAMGEGWHNNHHRFPNSARFGLGRWQVDQTWWLLRALAALGLIWDLRVPAGAGEHSSYEVWSPAAGR